MEWNAQDCGISKAAKDTSMLPSKIDQMKASHETGSEANFGFGRALMPSYLGMLPPKAAFFSFWMQPMIDTLPHCNDGKMYIHIYIYIYIYIYRERESLFAKTDNSVFINFLKSCFLLCYHVFIVLVSCICLVIII